MIGTRPALTISVSARSSQSNARAALALDQHLMRNFCCFNFFLLLAIGFTPTRGGSTHYEIGNGHTRRERYSSGDYTWRPSRGR